MTQSYGEAMFTRSLTLLALLVGCHPFPDAHYTGTSYDFSEADTANPLDPTLQEQIESSERFDLWMETMSPYVLANPDQTYVFDRENFFRLIAQDYPEVVDHYERNAPETPDTVTIDGLLEGIALANQYILDQAQSSGTAPPPSIYSGWYWWGYQRCYTSSDSDAMIAKMSVGSASLTLSGIGTIPGGVLALLTGLASYYDSRYGGFCLNIQWNTQVTVSRP